MNDTVENRNDVEAEDTNRTKVPIRHESDVIESKEAGNNAKTATDEDDRPKDPRSEIAEKFERTHRNFSAEQPSDPDADEGDDEAAPAEPEMITVKVNGKERQVDKAKVDAAGGVEIYQKQLAANEGLRQLSEDRKLLDQEITRIRQEREALEQQMAELSRPKPDAERDLPEIDGDQLQALKQKASGFREALFDGDEDKADEILTELLIEAQKNPATPNDAESVVESAASKAVQMIEQDNHRKSLINAFEALQSDYSDIVDDPRLWNMTDAETVLVKREHPEWTPDKIMREAGDRIRQWRDTRSGEQPPKPGNGTTIDDKRQEKRQLSTPSGGSRRSQPKPAPKPETNSEYIQRLRQQRGLE